MRPAAYKMKIEDVVRGQYVRSPDGTEPSHLLTPWSDRVTRVRVMGAIVDKFVRDDQNYATLRIDDGSETVTLRAWQEGVKELDKFKVGENIDAIGRVREFGGEIYLTPELIIPVEDPNWELVRELEILTARRGALAAGVRPKLQKLEPSQLNVSLPSATSKAEPVVGTEAAEEEPPLPDVPDEAKKRVLLAIEKLDKGSGVDLAEISSELNMNLTQANDALKVMFVNGEIFEHASGKFKIAR